MNWNKYPNFSEEEFTCSHTGLCNMDERFMDILQEIRTEYGKPMTVTSGYRHKTHPIELRKSKPGSHSRGTCADIVVRGEDAFNLLRIALDNGIKRIGIQQSGENRFLHLGIEEKETLSPWIWSY